MTTPTRLRQCSILLAASLAACAVLPAKDGDVGGSDRVAEEVRQGSVRRPDSVVPIAYGQVVTARLTRSAQFRGFTFAGTRGRVIDLYADGLSGLDTVAYLYRAARDGAPTGPALASNDDTAAPGWVVRSNAAPNALSSNVLAFTLPATGQYTLVVTSYRQRATGAAEVVVKTPPTCDPAEAARRHWFTGRSDGGVTREFATEAEATRYQDPEGRSVYWLVRVAESASAVSYVAGINDLWAVRFDVARDACGITVTGEH